MEKYIIRRNAFMNAIAKFDLSTLSAELQAEITKLRQTLQDEVTEDNINQIYNLLEQCPRLKEIYDDERLALKSSRHEQERSKGFPVTGDNPKPKDLGLGNVNPPTSTSETETENSQTPEKETQNPQTPKTENNTPGKSTQPK